MEHTLFDKFVPILCSQFFFVAIPLAPSGLVIFLFIIFYFVSWLIPSLRPISYFVQYNIIIYHASAPRHPIYTALSVVIAHFYYL